MKDYRAKKLDRLVRQYHIAVDDCRSFIGRLKQHVANYNDAILANGVELVGERFDELNDTVEAMVAVAQGSVPIVGDPDYPKMDSSPGQSVRLRAGRNYALSCKRYRRRRGGYLLC